MEIFKHEIKLQKSQVLLFPLIGSKFNALYVPKKTYLFWQEYSIENFELTVFYKEISKEFEKTLMQSKYLIACYKVEEGMIYIYDLISFQDSVFHFLQGQYSKYSEADKKTILKYFGANQVEKKASNVFNIHVALFPEFYQDMAKKEMGYDIDDDIYFPELFSKYSRDSETLTVESKDNCNCVELKELRYNI